MPVDFGKRGDEEDKTLIIVREQLAKAKAAAESLHDMARWQKLPKRTAKLGVISESIVSHWADLSQDFTAEKLIKHGSNPTVQDAPKNFARLPNEVQSMIWSFLTEQPDRLMLALTCKWNATMYESLKDTPQNAQKKASPKNNSSLVKGSKGVAKKPRPATITMKERFAVMYRLQPKPHEEVSIIPKKFKLCYNCLRFVPRSYVAASRAKGKTGGFGWSGKHLDLNVAELKPRELRDAMSTGYHCPDCVARAAFDTVKLRQDAEEWKRVVDQTLKV